MDGARIISHRRIVMARRETYRRRVRRSEADMLDRLDRRIERRMNALDEAFDAQDYAEIVKQADAIADTAEQGVELSDR